MLSVSENDVTGIDSEIAAELADLTFNYVAQMNKAKALPLLLVLIPQNWLMISLSAWSTKSLQIHLTKDHKAGMTLLFVREHDCYRQVTGLLGCRVFLS